MKNKYSVVLAVCFSMSLAFLVASQDKNPQRKGTIEEENGVRIIKNPNKPLYGEIAFDLEEDLSIGSENDNNTRFFRIMDVNLDNNGNILVTDMKNFRIQVFSEYGKYLRTIGRKGQGPGEFDNPYLLRVNNTDGLIYVLDQRRNIEVFNEKGDYLNTIHVENGIMNFYPNNDGSFVAVVHKYSPSAMDVLCQFDSKGEILKTFDEYPYTGFSQKIRGGEAFLVIYTGYELSVHLAKLDKNTFVYGYSKEYELNVMDLNFDVLFKIKNEVPYPKFDKAEERIFNRGRVKIPIPEYKPYFYKILSDSEERIYIQRNMTHTGGIEVDRIRKIMDVFSKEGHFLFTTTLPPNTCIIRDGYIYSFDEDEEAGMEYVKRYKIKNWDEIKK